MHVVLDVTAELHVFVIISNTAVCTALSVFMLHYKQLAVVPVLQTDQIGAHSASTVTPKSFTPHLSLSVHPLCTYGDLTFTPTCLKHSPAQRESVCQVSRAHIYIYIR